MSDFKRLYRSKTDRRISGVCGGLAEYFNIDASLVRIVVLFFALFGGSGGIFYILASMIIPEEPDYDYDEKPKRGEE